MNIIVKDNGEEEAFTEKRIIIIITVITFICSNNGILKRNIVISDVIFTFLTTVYTQIFPCYM